MIGIHDENQVYVYSSKEALVAEIIDNYFKEYDHSRQVGLSWNREELVDKSIDELVDILMENEEVYGWIYVGEGRGFYFT